MDVEVDGGMPFLSGTQMDGLEDAREFKLAQYNEALVHAVLCKIADCKAYDDRCRKVKAHLVHISKCYNQRKGLPNFRIDGCPICAKIWGLLCYHAKCCATALGTNCPAPQCDYLRQKIAQHSVASHVTSLDLSGPQDPSAVVDDVERRKALAAAAREETLRMLAELRAQKAEREQQQQQRF